MIYSNNQPVYYIPCVRFRQKHEHKFGNFQFNLNDEFPIEQDVSYLNYEKGKVHIAVLGSYGMHIIPVPEAIVEMFVKVIHPKFWLGDIVIQNCFEDKDKNFPAYRIFEYTVRHGSIWYRNGWSVATGCEAGVCEENLRFASDDEAASWQVEYYDNLVKDKDAQRYNCIVK